LNDGREVVLFAFEATRFGRNLFVIVAIFGNFFGKKKFTSTRKVRLGNVLLT